MKKQLFILPAARRWRTGSAALAAATVGCGAALAQTNPVPPPTETPAQPPAPLASGSSTNVTKLEEMTVVGHLDVARNQIVPDLGATTYTLTQDQITAQAQGANAPFNQALLRMPGMAQDSLGQLHLRGEHGNIQYRINDVLLPEGITGFGPELDTRFVDSMRLITGSLPAQYGFRTAGIVDVKTKSGAFDKGGDAEIYGGSYDTVRPSFEYGGSQGKLNYFVDGSYDHNDIGIENPTASATPIHDWTSQYKTFSYLSYVLDDTSRISVMLSASYTDYEIPNAPGNTTPTFTTAPGQPVTFDSANLNERQNEQNYYGVVAYQKSVGDLNLQVAAFGRNSSVHFRPDPVGDLYFNGVASDVNRGLYSGGLQGDASYALGEKHTLRGGVMAMEEVASAQSATTVYSRLPANVDPITGNPIAPAYTVPDSSLLHGWFYGVYLQDEWKVTSKLTLNYGARFDAVSAFVDENQVSPRINAIYKASDATTLHAGYARYFTPPPLELVRSGTVQTFDNTSNAAKSDQNDPARSERAHYFDAGLSQKLAPGLQVGLDGYYKIAHNQLDDGFFGQTLILAPFNYRVGMVEGVELTATYTKEGFSTFANLAFSDAMGKDIVSSQFLFDPATVAYSHNSHNGFIHLDHDQRITGSFGMSYLWKQTRSSTRVFTDVLYGSGLRTDLVLGDGSVIPNGASVGPYYSINLGVEERIKLGLRPTLTARLDVVNITDNVYQLRNGAGVGVSLPQYGMRLGFFGSLRLGF